MSTTAMPATPPPAAARASDADLLGAFIDGDRAAFTELATRHAAMVLASCRRQLGNRADADDATQATFLVLARKPRDAATAPVLAAWLLRVARHVSANLRRGRLRRARIEQEAAMANAAPATAASPEADALAHLDELLDSLPEHERRVVVMHVMQGVGQDEVARLLGCPMGTVRSRLSRGLARLRDAFARRGIVMSLAALATLLASNAGAAVAPELAASLAQAGSSASPTAVSAADAAIRLLRPRTPLTGVVGGLAAIALLGGAAWWWTRDGEAEPARAVAVAPRAPAATVAPATIADPAAYLPADPDLSMRLNDWHRTLARLKRSPYADFMTRPSAKAVADDLEANPRYHAWNPASLRSAAFAAHLRGNAMAMLNDAARDPSRLADLADFAVGADLAPRDGLIDDAVRGNLAVPADQDEWTVARPWGEVVRQGDLLLATNRAHQAGSRLPAAATPLPPAFADADFECVSTPGLLAAGKPTPAVSLASTLTEHGLRSERLVGRGEEDPPGPIAPLDPRLLRTLPADTLVAFARRCSALDVDLASGLALASSLGESVGKTRTAAADQDADTTTTATVAVNPVEVKPTVEVDELTKQRIETMRQTLAGFGIPQHLTLDGDLLIYARAGEPWPSLTIAAAMPEEQARRLIAAAARLLAAPVGDDGAVAGRFFGVLPLAADYRDGGLVVTTAPEGVAAHRERAGGFDASPEVAAGIAAIPATAYGACVANGPAAWSTLARLGAGMTGDQEFATKLRALGDDLAASCHGHPEYLYTVADESGRRSVAEGPVFGILGLILDAGMGALPLKSLWN